MSIFDTGIFSLIYRWVNFYHPDLKLRRKWSKKEDVQLLEAVAKYGVGKKKFKTKSFVSVNKP